MDLTLALIYAISLGLYSCDVGTRKGFIKWQKPTRAEIQNPHMPWENIR